jgi:hypothetical protein
VIAGGLFIGLLAFVITSQTQAYMYLGGPGIHVISKPGFDAWTGLPHGSTIEYRQTPFSLARAPHTDDVPVELRDRRAIPLPVGFAVGVAVVLVVAEQRRTRVRP